MTARGCPRACVFCMSPYGRRTIREMSPGRVMEEMDWAIEEFRPTTYKFNDESFGFNGDRMHAILDGMLSRGFGKKTRFIASMRADRVTAGLLRKMKEANFYAVEVGVETGDETIPKNIKKGESLAETERAVRLVKEHGFRVLCGFIIGHPGDTRETVLRTIDFAARLDPDVAAFGLMVPYPGTDVAEYAATGRYGYRLLSDDWSTYNKQYGGALELEELPRAVMERLQIYAYLKVFLANRRFGDAARFL